MNMTLSPALSRALALMLLFAAAAAGWGLVVEPVLLAQQSYEQRIAEATEQVGRYNRVGATREPLSKQLEELRRRGRSTRGYLQGTSHSLAAAALQNRIKKIVERHRGTVKSVQMLPARDEGELQRVPIRVQLTAELPALQKILHAFETARTYLFLNDISIRVKRSRRSRRGKKTAPENRTLTIRLEVYGYIRAGKA